MARNTNDGGVGEANWCHTLNTMLQLKSIYSQNTDPNQVDRARHQLNTN